ncbi:S41 family peptidase [Taibaiella koreensis]|uniref:S41 family peptidase n=1 Tax=Taibaiella koreensis TaxID=1268548 RepID=UPI000E59D295|nr:S41 family peptidase [Taibaiella koreensis]
MRIILLIVSIAAFSTIAHAQQSDFDFVVEKIKLDYPGFIEKTHGFEFDSFVTKTAKTYKTDSFKAMAIIIDFFKDRHLDLFRNKEFQDSAECYSNLNMIRGYFGTRKDKEVYEGFWITETNNCIIGLQRIQGSKDCYRGYVIKCAANSSVLPGTLLCELEQRSTDQYFTRAMGVRSGLSYYVTSKFRSDSIMTMGPYYKWRKLRATSAQVLPTLTPLSDSAKGKWLNDTTFLLSIPTSIPMNENIVTKILRSNQELITKCSHLIIDVRNNTGGSARVYDPLYPLFYTKPFASVAGSLYATKDEGYNKQQSLEKYVEDGGKDTAHINWMKKLIALNNDSTGKFIQFPTDTFKQDYVYEYPKKISIIVNFGCQSACEIFLLDAKHSSRVRLFGEHTMGAIDYLNFYPQNTPSGKYKLYIATTRRNIPPGESRLDGKGIEPDVQISDSETDWVDFVKRYYEKH